jgi:hypothetical protein
MHLFDPTALKWTQIKPDEAYGPRPSARNKLGFASVKGNLFVYGGESKSGLQPLNLNSTPEINKSHKLHKTSSHIKSVQFDSVVFSFE